MSLHEKNDPEISFPVVRARPSQCCLIVEMEKMFHKEFGFEHHDEDDALAGLRPARDKARQAPFRP
jgi:hypothetical protein